MTECIAACNLESFTELNNIQHQAGYGVYYRKEQVNKLKVFSRMVTNEDR